MNWSGLSDSRAVTALGSQCPRCQTTARLSRGLCLGCLLSSVLDERDPSPDDLAALLSAVPASHTLWRLGNYEILEEIGRGGMGVIYRARQRHSRRIVALKRLPAHSRAMIATETFMGLLRTTALGSRARRLNLSSIP